MRRIFLLLTVLALAAVGPSPPGLREAPSVPANAPLPEAVPQPGATAPAINPIPGGIVFPSAITIESITPLLTAMVSNKAALNEDTVGWLVVPGTDIDREVLKNPPAFDNNYYLRRGFDGLPDPNGTYCADRRCVFGEGREGLSRNTVLYGHSFDDDPDGTLFSQIKRYRDIEFARQNPYIFFSTDSEDMVWEVFAVIETTVNVPYNVPGLAGGQFYDMLDLVYEASLYRYEASVGPNDKLLTLSTCVFSVAGHERLPDVNSYRFAVMARLMDPAEPLREKAMLVPNAAPLPPDEADALIDAGALREYSFGIKFGN